MPTDDGPPTSRDKLVATKRLWAMEGRGLVADEPDTGIRRVPPGQHEVATLPVLDLGTQPNLAQSDWSLTVGGAVEHPLKWDWRAFQDQPQIEVTADIHCVTTWSIHGTRWQGVATAHLLAQVRPRSGVRFVMLKGYDGYSTNLPLHRFAAADALIAHRLDGQPLPREHGGPVRLVVPQLYFWKSAKWLRAITFMDQDSPGYWELRGYHDEGDPWKQQRYR